MKRPTPNFCSAEEDKLDNGIGRRIIVKLIDDLLKIDIDVGFYKLGYRPFF